MEYVDIIKENSERNSQVSWWPRFAYHYTDVQNAVGILNSGYLYSRFVAEKLKVMKNDNASRQVIDMTSPDVRSMVRLYFRPLTPTQYYNEGYKHPDLRYDGDENANVPVPVFLLFDLEKLLNLPGVQFSEMTQAGHGSEMLSGVDAFSKLNFANIYDNSYERFEESKPYRHAEIVYPDSLRIESCIKNILCRTDLERATLLNLLRQTNRLAFSKYNEIVKVYSRDTFECNGMFVAECAYHENTISVSLSDFGAERRYINRMMERRQKTQLKPINIQICIRWFNSTNVVTKKLIDQKTVEFGIDILEPRKPLSIRGLPTYQQAKEIDVEIFFDNKLMCSVNQPLEPSEVWK